MAKKRRRNDGLTKRCRCRRCDWGTCQHSFHFSMMRKGKHYRLSLEEAERDKAQIKANEIKNQIIAGTFGPQQATTPVTLRQLLDVYFQQYVKVHRSNIPNEKWSRQIIERTDLPTIGGAALPSGNWPIADIKPDTLEQFKQARLAAGGGRVAINRNLTLLRAAFNWAIHPGGYLVSTPFKVGTRTVVKLFAERARERRLEPGEEERLLAACGPHLRALVVAALETSCRVGELLSLQWSQVRWAQNEIHLPAGKTKSKKPRYLPMSQRLKAVLEMRRTDPDGNDLPADAYVFGNELGEQIKSVRKAWGAACRKAAITDLHFHDLRRESASRLIEGHVPENAVQSLLGHANLTTTSRYLATTRKGLHQVMRQYEQRRDVEEPGDQGQAAGVESGYSIHGQ